MMNDDGWVDGTYNNKKDHIIHSCTSDDTIYTVHVSKSYSTVWGS